MGHQVPHFPVRDSISHPDDFFDELYHVPLFFKTPHESNRVINKLTSGIDIAPTILELVDIKINKNFKGKNILADHKREYVLMENQGRPHAH